MSDVDCTVVGAGVVGLAIARALARAGHDVIVVEREPALGTGVSSRNSEVLHAGLYYPTGSLKAALCLRGNALAYDYCASRGIAHRRCGKLVVAADETERSALERIAERATANGVQGARWLEPREVQALEPALRCVAALHVPSSGIVDSHALMLALLADAESHGATLAVASPFAGATPRGDGWQLRTAGDDAFTMSTRWLINAAGLGAQRVARSIEGLPAAWVPQAHFAKGHYFSLAGRSPFSRLIYPIPVDGGLGVHLTIDLAGQAKFGPDVEWLDTADEAAIDYRVQPARAAAFEADIRRWWPALPADALAPAYSGVRPKISGPGEPAADFRIDGPAAHGLAGLVNLFGIESPGLTAALALGEHVAAMVR